MEEALLPDISKITSNNGLWLTIICFGACILLCFGFLCINKKPKKQQGYLQFGKQFLNVGDYIFEDNEENHSCYIVPEDKKTTVWEREILDKHSFILKTEMNGFVYGFTVGSPGYASPNLICSASPLVAGSQNVVFKLKPFEASSNVWQDQESVALHLAENGFIVWGQSKPATTPKFIPK